MRRGLVGWTATVLAVVAAVVVGVEVDAWAKKPKPCAASLDVCPEHGCATKNTPDALVNKLKRTIPNATAAVFLTLDDFENLQDQADADNAVGQGKSLTKKQRNKLKKLKTSAGEVAEGALVEVAGYIVGKPHHNKSGESVNCRLMGPDNNDVHITIAKDPEDEEFDGIVAETIPQKRHDGWTLARMRKAKKDERRVLIRGQLFYDNKHLVNADPDEPLSGQPKRFSLWEVHPVTGMWVCGKPDKKCDEKQVAKWTALETWSP